MRYLLLIPCCSLLLTGCQSWRDWYGSSWKGDVALPDGGTRTYAIKKDGGTYTGAIRDATDSGTTEWEIKESKYKRNIFTGTFGPDNEKVQIRHLEHTATTVSAKDEILDRELTFTKPTTE